MRHPEGIPIFFDENSKIRSSSDVKMRSTTIDVHCEDRFIQGHLIQQKHSFYEILYFRTGGLHYLIQDKKYTVHDGDLLFLPPHVIHGPVVSGQSSANARAYVMWVNPSFLKTLCPESMEIEALDNPMMFATEDIQWNFLRKCFTRAIQAAQERQPGWEFFLHGYASQLIGCVCHIMKSQGEKREESLSETLLEQVLDYIQKNIYSKITITETANHFHVSESTISHLLQKEINISFYRCVKQRKLMEAKRLIESGFQIQKVSKLIGYQEYSSFYRAFRDEYGVSPLQFRRNNPNA